MNPQESQDYRVQLEIFEGPLDLLLYLIKKDEIDIYQISIQRITQQYLEHLNTFELLNVELASEFIVMAANLMYLKSRELLPVEIKNQEDDPDTEDPRWDLIKQLVEYKKFKDVASHLSQLEIRNDSYFPTAPEPFKIDNDKKKFKDEEIGLFDLIQAFQNILRRFDQSKELKEIVDDRFTVADKIESILNFITIGQTVSFTCLFNDLSSRNEMIVTFLAMLELIKLKHLIVNQTHLLSDIQIERLPV
jgi:segregation and condensation protein A